MTVDDSAEPRGLGEASRRDRTKTPIVSLLVIVSCYLIAMTDPDARRRWHSIDKGEIDRLTSKLEQGRAARQIGFLALGAWGSAMLLTRRSDRPIRVSGRVLLPLAVYASWAVISVIWSDDRALTAKRLIVFGCGMAGVVAFARHFKPRDLARLALIGSGLTLGIGIATELMHLGDEAGIWGYRFAGTLHPNHAGINAVIALLAGLYFFDRTSKPVWLVLALVASVVLLLTKSRTALGAGLVATGVFLALRWPIRRTAAVALGLVMANLVLLMLYFAGLLPAVWGALLMGRKDSDVTTLTGRSDIWAAAFDYFSRDPVRYLTGYGYQSFWSPRVAEYVSNRVQFHISEGHNAYLDSLFTLGIVGLMCYAAMLLGSIGLWVSRARSNRNAAYAFLAAMLVFALVHGVAESTTVDPNFPTFITFTAITMAALHAPRSAPHIPQNGQTFRGSHRP
jgi:O-antigen ligase